MSASDRSPPRRARRGFTLVEVLVSTTLLGLLMLAVLTSFVFLLRSQQSLANYTDMNADARRLLELLSRDTRSATTVTDFTATSLTLVVPVDTAGGTGEVTYDFDPADSVMRRTAAGATVTLATGVDAFRFTYLNGNNAVTTSLAELKQVQLSLHLARTVSLATTSQYVISAQYTLRAKPTSH